jgi:hypothetical protein
MIVERYLDVTRARDALHSPPHTQARKYLASNETGARDATQQGTNEQR